MMSKKYQSGKIHNITVCNVGAVEGEPVHISEIINEVMADIIAQGKEHVRDELNKMKTDEEDMRDE